MVVGFIQGPVKLYLNDGKLAFAEKGKLTSGGKVISESDGGPCVVDWDGDGTLDLLMGSGQGGVRFFKGKTIGALDLDPAVKLVGAGTGGWQTRGPDPKGLLPFTPFEPGVRTKPFAADWNGDGKLDLLVGDYISVLEKPRTLTAKEAGEVKRIDARIASIGTKMPDIYSGIRDRAMKSIGKKPGQTLTPAESKKYSAALSKLVYSDKRYMALSKEWGQLYTRRQTLMPEGEGTGFVWVYLRK